MAFNGSSLVSYVDQTKDLILKTQFKATSADYLSVLPGVKGPTSLNLVDNAISFQVNGCGFNPVGDTTLSQVTLTPGNIKVNKDFCMKDLRTWYTRHMLAPGTRNEKESMIAEQAFVENIVANTAATLETALWQGDITSGNVNLNKFDGFLKVISGSSAIAANTAAFIPSGPISAATGITTSNAYDIVYGTYLAVPEAALAKGDVYVYGGMDTFRKFVKNGTDKNLFHYTTESEAGNKVIIPGTNTYFVGLNGLSGTNRLIGASMSNMVYGVDLLDDVERFVLRFDDFTEKLDLIIEFTAGVAVAFPDQISQFKLA